MLQTKNKTNNVAYWMTPPYFMSKVDIDSIQYWFYVFFTVKIHNELGVNKMFYIMLIFLL